MEGSGLKDAAEPVSDSQDIESKPPDVAATLTGIFAGLPTLPGPQRLAISFRQKFVHNSGEFHYCSSY